MLFWEATKLLLLKCYDIKKVKSLNDLTTNYVVRSWVANQQKKYLTCKKPSLFYWSFLSASKMGPIGSVNFGLKKSFDKKVEKVYIPDIFGMKAMSFLFLYVHSLISYKDLCRTINPYVKSKISEDQTIF